MTREPSLAACRRVAMEWPECCGSFSSMQASVLTIYTSQERASVSLRIPALRFLPSSNTEPHSPTEMITSLKSWGRISAAPTTSSAVSGEVSETTIIGTPALRPSAGLPPVLRRRNGWGCGAGPVHAGTQLAAGPRPPLPFSTIDIPRPMQAKRNQPKTPMCGARQAQRSWQFPIADWKSEPRHPGCRGEKTSVESAIPSRLGVPASWRWISGWWENRAEGSRHDAHFRSVEFHQGIGFERLNDLVEVGFEERLEFAGANVASADEQQFGRPL